MGNLASTYSAVSLFSGAGGLDLGFENSGFSILFANELDEDAANTWCANRQENTAMYRGDIANYLGSLSRFKNADVVFGGPPCQGFSVAGKMNPDDPRSRLIWSFLDAVAEITPRAFVIENVRALGALSKWAAVREGIVKRAGDLGYRCGYEIFSAKDYGVPQNRERVVFVGVRGNSDSLDGFFREMRSRTKAARALRDVLLAAGKYGTEENPQTCTSHVSLAKQPVLRKSPYAGMLVNGAGRPLNLDGTSHTLPASMGGNKTPIVDQRALDEGSRNWFEVYHERLVEGKTTPEDETVPDFIRRLTIKEAAAIQTFPGSYVFCGRKTQQYKQIGNAVAPGFAEAIAQSLVASCLC